MVIPKYQFKSTFSSSRSRARCKYSPVELFLKVLSTPTGYTVQKKRISLINFNLK
jgi:hypothetical protein